VIVVLLKKLVHRPGRLWVDGKGKGLFYILSALIDCFLASIQPLEEA
jgi:hypothetical protein